MNYPQAGQVFVIGSFNHWSTTANPMSRSADGRWEAALDLSPGRYPYCYFVIQGVGDAGPSCGPGLPLHTQIINTGAVLDVPGDDAPGAPDTSNQTAMERPSWN